MVSNRGGGQTAISLTPGADGAYVCIFKHSPLEGSCVGDLLSYLCLRTFVLAAPCLEHLYLPTQIAYSLSSFKNLRVCYLIRDSFLDH